MGCYHEAEAKIFEMASNCFYRQPEVDNTGLDFIRLTLYVTNWNQLKVCKNLQNVHRLQNIMNRRFLDWNLRTGASQHVCSRERGGQ